MPSNTELRPALPGLDRVQHSRVRKIVDPVFVTAKTELDACHYGESANGVFKRDGESGWKYGKSAPFRGYDIIVSTLPAKLVTLLNAEGQEILTEEQARGLFNTLAGLMDLARRVVVVKANRNISEPYDEDDINPIVDQSKDRTLKGFSRQHIDKFLEEIEATPPATYEAAATLWNNITIPVPSTTTPLEIRRSAGHELIALRKKEDETGIKARTLTGTLPEA